MPDPPQTPAISSRERSDTILTTSSSDSFPHPLTPQTPSILGVLTTQQTIPYKTINVESPTDVLGFTRNRQNSYGFGTTLLSSSPEIQGHSSLVEDPESILPIHTTIPQLEPPLQLNTGPTDIAQQEDRLTDPNRLSISTDGTADISDNAASPNRRSKLKAVVRRKLERSKSSFRSLRRSKEDGGDDHDNTLSSPPSLSNLSVHGTSPAQANGSSSMTIPRPGRSRLKSLLSMSRAPSSTSIRSTHVTSATHRQGHPPLTSSHIGHHEITVRDYAHHPLVGLPVGARTRHLSVDGVVQLNRITPLTEIYHRDGIERARELPDEPATIEEESQITHPVRIARPRALSMPLLDTTATALLVEEPEEIAEEERNYFDTVLPRELKVLIMKTLLEVHIAEGGNTRWSGEPGGRRELIKLSRVSKTWQHLCLDGQLWSHLELTPYAHVMHPNTVKRILKYSLPFITTLSFQGLNRLRGAALIPFLSPFDWSPHPRSDGLTVWLPNLRHLDLRGTHRLSPSHISSVIVGSPGLKSINLRAVESCTSEVIRTIARSTRVLESLDVSRCKELTLGDMIFLINAMDESQCSRLTTLKIGGLKSYGRHASEFLPLLARRLVNLEVLDAQECLHLFDEDFERFAMALKENGRKSPIRHLNLSGCSALNGQFMVHLTGMLPNLRILEFANLTHLYKEEGGSPDDDLPLMRFMRTIPSIEKIDLDLTGVNGGVTDRVIDSLSKYRSEETDEIVGKGLRELRIGSAKDVTAEGICRLIRNCEGLGVLEIDNTAADNSVLRNFLKLHPKGRISIIDCRAITSSELDKLDSSTNTRIGHEGWQFAPFTYTALELAAGQGTRGVVKSFSSWRNTVIPRSWREIRKESDREANIRAAREYLQDGDSEEEREGEGERKRRGSWWTMGVSSGNNMDMDGGWDDAEAEGAGRGCLVM